jgi:hypothetical protein
MTRLRQILLFARQNWAALLFVLFGLAIVAGAAIDSDARDRDSAARERVTACQTQNFEDLQRALSERTAPSVTQQEALRKLTTLLLEPNATAGDRRAALIEFQGALDRLNAARIDNPLPVVTKCH